MEATLTDPDAIRLRDRLVESLRSGAPRGHKCVFLNCELHQTPGGVTVSGDLFSVVAPMFGKPRRVQRTLDLQEVRILDELGPMLMKIERKEHVTLDLVIASDGKCHTFFDFSPLRRIGGDDDFFKTKHKAYTQIEPWLAQVD
jgi:hypothetical protein